MNKYQVEIILPFFEKSYDVLIPINKKIGTIRKYIIKTIADFLEIDEDQLKNYNIINSETGYVYDYNLYVKDSDIKNGTNLLLI